MFPAPLAYAAPDSVEEVLALLVEHEGEAKVLAGGCSLIPLLKFRLADVPILVDLRRAMPGSIEERDGELHIGAMTRESAVEHDTLLRDRIPILVETSSVIADPVVRNMGTLGGNLAHADPANDHPATMLALDASVILVGPGGERRIAIDAFFVDLYETALQPTEIVREIVVPLPPAGSGGAYEKLERQVGDFAIVGAAAQLTLADGRVTAVRIGLTNVASTALRATAAEAILVGREPTDALLRDAAAATVDGLAPWDELRGSAGYKLQVLPVIARRALERAVRRAREGASQVGDASPAPWAA